MANTEAQKRAQRNRYWRHKKAGLCRRCTRPATVGRHCAEHAAYMQKLEQAQGRKAIYARRRERCIDAGICTRCRKRPARATAQICNACHEQQRRARRSS